MRSNTLSQNTIPCAPRDIALSSFDATDILDAVAYIRKFKPPSAALSVRLSPAGLVDTITLATPSRVVSVLWDPDAVVHTGLQKTAVSALFSDPKLVFVGFGMAHIALLLWSSFGCHVRGVEVSALSAVPDSKSYGLSPDAFIHHRVSDKVSQRAVHDLWEGTHAPQGLRDASTTCYQAWITAV